MKPTVLLATLACLVACTEDTRLARDASVSFDGATDVDTGPGVDAGPGDSDLDGVVGFMDSCPSTAPGEPVDASGCSTVDDDNDGVFNDMDRCDDTAAGANVDGLGCTLVNQGTLDAAWLINGETADAATCAAAGIAEIRLIIDRAGANFLRREFPCAQGGFDGREDASAPQVPRNETFTNYWQALDSSGAVVTETDETPLLLRDVEHMTLSSADFITG